MYLATSKEAVSAVLMAERKRRQCLVHYVSRSLHDAERNYALLEKVALALLHVSRRLMRYFEAHSITIIADQPIKQILNKAEASGRLAKYYVELGAYNISYEPRSAIKGQILMDFINKAQAKRLFRDENVCVEMHMGIDWDKVENLSPQSTPQVLQSFEVYTPPVTYPEEVEENLGTPIEVEPLDKTQLEDLGLNTCNHDITLSFRDVPSFDEPEPQPQPLPNCPPLDVSLGNERGLKPPIKPHSPDSFRMKVLDNLTIHTPPSSLVASFHPKDTYCYYHSCIDDPKKHYGFKSGLLGQSGSLGRGLNLPIKLKEVEKVRIKDSHHLEHIFQPLFPHMAPLYHNGVYHYYHPHLNLSVGEPSPLSVK
ncbi:ribonuclease H-like domain-containing protein [Tanacetum coccineum]|uniref:Ribonuclease H-like domain-containing protein n=1 Tax=Tanacetum coccineum TaxID=301880 RepID=A0ABQ5AFK2_9ASTR